MHELLDVHFVMYSFPHYWYLLFDFFILAQEHVSIMYSLPY